ncbi:maleylpyruvate isomerase family mycothiol-dependent enzyme [Streptomyces sp. BB1-1-1]|uniref:maleylpyruvate isomerase family mycothiol-dependent enzyme n=1 Tax=unclassified Streptomyces TaxID=2593676 RepID=UPI00287734E3|nr:maleylpyruvate isomerase family mycothiol-dependent enzyme [Streptomyces sp. BB1-1-1]WND39382.1 maleylpyruvate isomerase family mycothiol-dependent enzyme [Streptomyces sp. BB1-1-1]
MEYSRFLDCLAADYDRLRAVVETAADAPVPTCPGWTVADLTRHVGEVYLHKTVAMREGVEPEPWPPEEFAKEEPTALLDRGYTALRAEFATRAPEDPAAAWYGPDQSVGFWIRRMAQETVIHRIDAELGTGQAVAPVPADLAVDGIDELLKVFAAYSVAEWGEYFTDILADSPGRTYLVRAGDAAWRVRTGPGEFVVTDGAGDGTADVTFSGSPEGVLRRLWNREGADGGSGGPGGSGDSRVMIEGDPEAVEVLRRCIVVAAE